MYLITLRVWLQLDDPALPTQESLERSAVRAHGLRYRSGADDCVVHAIIPRTYVRGPAGVPLTPVNSGGPSIPSFAAELNGAPMGAACELGEPCMQRRISDLHVS